MAEKEQPTDPSAVQTAEPKPKKRSRSKADRKNQRRELPPYNVVLLDDDEHTYEYVVEMLKALFAYPDQKGYQLAKEVDTRKRVIVLTTHKEKAELKRDQIHAYGADFRMTTSKGSMTAVIEPAGT